MIISFNYFDLLKLKIEVNESLELLKAEVDNQNTLPSSYLDTIEIRNSQIIHTTNTNTNTNTTLNSYSSLTNEKEKEHSLKESSSELSDLTSLSDLIPSSPANKSFDKNYEVKKLTEKGLKIKKIILTFYCPKYKLTPTNKRLLDSLLSIYSSNRKPVKCVIKDDLIVDKDVGVCYYSYKLHKWYQKNLQNSKKEIKNNYLLLLFKIGEFTSINKCGLKFKNALFYFKDYSRYLEVYKVCRLVYRIWNPLPGRNLLKINEFKFGQFIRLTNRDILKFRQSIHSSIKYTKETF